MSDLNANILSLFTSNSTNDATTNLINSIYGNTGSGTQSGINAVSALNNAEKNETKEVAATAAEPQIARDISAFRTAVGKATSVQQLLDNPTALKVLLTANGLGSFTSYTALAQKALMSNPVDKKSLANQLSNTQWASTAQTYDFYDKGLSIIQTPSVIDAVANGYAEVAWRNSLDASTPGLSNALTFRAQASSVTSALQILGDSTLRTVVTTALNIPLQIAYQPLEAQEKAITNQLDISKLQDPKFVETFIQKYLVAAANAAAATSSTGSTTDLLSLAVQSSSLVV